MKKFKISLANDLDKEARWLTEMSSKGFQFFKYSWFFYYFVEDHSKSYIYQTDFQDATDEYFELYEQAGWEHVHSEMSQFHYFRADRETIGDKRIYSDPASIKGMYKRMLLFYTTIFICMIVAQTGLLLNWENSFLSILAVTIVTAVIVLYIFLFIKLLQKINKYGNQN